MVGRRAHVQGLTRVATGLVIAFVSPLLARLDPQEAAV